MNYTELLTKTQAEIDERYHPKKERSLYLADLYDSLLMHDRADRVRGCGTYLEFHISTESSKLSYANFCKDRLCPMCTFRRSLKTFHEVSRCLDFLEPRNYKYLFLTLTLKNCSSEDLIKTIDLLNSAKRKLFSRAKIKKFLQGAFCALEITYNRKTCTWHPHLHCLLAVSSSYGVSTYLNRSEWCQIWAKCADLDYFPQVDIRRVKSDDSDLVRNLDDLHDVGLKKAVREVGKYTVKDSQYLTGSADLDRSLVSTLSAALYKRKLVSFSGCFVEARDQLKLDDPVDGDLVDFDGLPRGDMLVAIVRFHWRAGVYVRKIKLQVTNPFDELPVSVNTGFVKCS